MEVKKFHIYIFIYLVENSWQNGFVITKVERNYLEINSLEDLNYSQKPGENCNFKFINPPDFQINKFFYKQIGKDHRWIDRLVWDDQKWIEYVENSNVKLMF